MGEDNLRERSGDAFEVEALLGTGAFGQVYRVRSVRDGSRFALKTARVGGGPEGVELLRELGQRTRSLAGSGVPGVAWLEETPLGTPGMMMPLYAVSLAERLREAPPLREVVAIVARAARAVSGLERQGQVHGNLRATNLLVDETGAVLLSDPLPARSFLAGPPPHPADPAPSPPEGRAGPEAAEGRASADTYALGAILYQSVRALSRRPMPQVGSAGISSPERKALEEALDELLSLAVPDSFRPRILREAVAITCRAASRRDSPSPPYRYLRAEEMAERLERLARMFRPEVVEVGPLRVEFPSGRVSFRSGEIARFAVLVSGSEGAADPDGIEVFTTVTDLDRGRKVTGARISYSVRRYDTGRMSYRFEVEDLPVGRMELKVAFRCAGSSAAARLAAASCVVEAEPRRAGREPGDDRDPALPGDALPEWRGERRDPPRPAEPPPDRRPDRVSAPAPIPAPDPRTRPAPPVPAPSVPPPTPAGSRRPAPSPGGTPWTPVSADVPESRTSTGLRRRFPPIVPPDPDDGEGGAPPRSR